MFADPLKPLKPIDYIAAEPVETQYRTISSGDMHTVRIDGQHKLTISHQVTGTGTRSLMRFDKTLKDDETGRVYEASCYLVAVQPKTGNATLDSQTKTFIIDRVKEIAVNTGVLDVVDGEEAPLEPPLALTRFLSLEP